MAGILLFALNSPGATSGPIVRARRDSAGSSGGGMFSRLRSLGSSSGSSVGDIGWASGSGPQNGGPIASSSTARPSTSNGPSSSSSGSGIATRPIVHRSYSTSTPASTLPSYLNSSSISDVPIPTYESVLSETANRIREMRASALATENYVEPVESGVNAGGLARVRRLGEISGSAIVDEDSEEDDPLVPRLRRGPPVPNLRPLGQLRRNTFSGTSSEADAEGSVRLGPAREGPLTPPLEMHADEEEEGVDGDVPESTLPPASSVNDSSTSSRTTNSVSENTVTPVVNGSEVATTDEAPAPPPNALPAYSAHLGPQELRLISTVHLDESHPASSFFAALANSSVSAGPVPPVDPQREQIQEYSTGGKKMKVFVNRGGMRMNQTHTGPLYIKVGRGGKIEGRVEVGKVDYAMSLEVAIIGLVNTSYYVRGQYTLIDTLPLVRRLLTLYPASPDESAPLDLGPELLFGNDGTQSGPSGSGSGLVPPEGEASATSPDTPTGTTSTVTTQPPLSRTISRPNFLKKGKSNANSKIMNKEGVLYLTPGQTFDFNLVMPNQHYRDSNVELPPSCQIYQVGMQAGVEYVLRIKMGRKGWRLNETITLPIVYEPRAYITPRRLRALTTDDPMNPGWRTIRLHGGKPAPKTNSNAQQPEQPAPVGPGVEGILLLPSPPILFIAQGQAPPPIPFHLHFHSSLTLPLCTFADPRESNFIIRLMRVATLRIGSEKEIRRMEIPSKVEIWQEGGARVRLGDEGSVGGAGVSVTVIDPGQAPPPAFTATDVNAPSEVEAVAAAFAAAEEQGQQERDDLAVATALRESLGDVEGGVVGDEAVNQSQLAPVAEVDVEASTPAAVVEDRPIISAINTSTSNITSSPTRPPLSASTITSVSPTSPSTTTDSGRRRLSFLRRRSSSTASPLQAPGTIEPSTLSRILSNIPPSISESADPGPASTSTVAPEIPAPEVVAETTLFAPLTRGSTDVHLLGELTIPHKITGTDVIRRMVQSFNTPDIGITYVLEVGIQPKRGAVKEAFEHLWGGGIVEVVLGNRGDGGEDIPVTASVV